VLHYGGGLPGYQGMFSYLFPRSIANSTQCALPWGPYFPARPGEGCFPTFTSPVIARLNFFPFATFQARLGAAAGAYSLLTANGSFAMVYYGGGSTGF
jgi:hypothetical protein